MLPHEHFTIDTPLPLDDARTQIRHNIELLTPKQRLEARPGYVRRENFAGEVYSDGFYLIPLFTQSANWLQIRGKLRPGANHTSIEVEVEFALAVKVKLAYWVAILNIVFTIISWQVRISLLALAAGVSIAMLLAWLALRLFFKQMAKDVRIRLTCIMD